MPRDTGPNALRRGRFSAPGAAYFLTLCVEPRSPILTEALPPLLLEHAHVATRDAVWQLRAMTVMPDHIHLFIELGETHTLSRAVARFKSATTRSLRTAGCDWQDNFYDHKLHPEDSAESVLRYIYLNPYAAELVPLGTPWPCFYCCTEDWIWFKPITDTGAPFPEWLR